MIGWARRALRRWRLIIFVLLIVLAGAAAYVFRPVPLRAAPPIAGLRASAEEGRYLAQMGNCAACHTVPGRAAFAGGMKFKTPFGTLYSTNITSDADHGIGKWSFAQFHSAMTNGQRPDGSHLYPAFPYTSFAKLSDRDIASLYLFFRTVPASAASNRHNDMNFPFGYRELLYFWQRLFHDSEAFSPRPDKSQAWNRGAYLVEGVTHCGACHTPRNFLGGSDNSRALTGGTYTDLTANGTYRTWSAVDLTPGANGLSSWSRDDIASYLTTGKNSHSVVHGPMRDVFASTKHLTPSDANAIAIYLDRSKPSSKRLDLSLFRSRIDEGEVVYTVHCGTCHLPDGKGDKILGVPLRRNALVQAKSPASLINVILYGPELPAAPFNSGRTTMKPFGKRLSDEDVAAVATYLRSSFGNNASAVSPDQVRRQR